MEGGEGRVVLITGASSGIGAATARLLARQGMRVVLTARRQDRLEALAREIEREGGAALAIPADLSDPSAREALVDQVEARWGPVEVLINNAGFGYYATVEDTPWEVVRRMFEVNILAMIHLTQRVVPGMRRLGRGHILNIASVAGYISTPPLTVYSATKFAVVGFSEGLRRELEPHGIHVTVISPGPVRTEFGRAASGLEVDPGGGAGRAGPGGHRPGHRPRPAPAGSGDRHPRALHPGHLDQPGAAPAGGLGGGAPGPRLAPSPGGSPPLREPFRRLAQKP
jgi:short-subunit dehydrogenase